MKERTQKVMMLWLGSIAFITAILTEYQTLVEMGYLIPMLITMPIGTLLSYLIFIKGIEDGLFFKKKEV